MLDIRSKKLKGVIAFSEKMQRQQTSALAKDMEDFRQFESKIDEVLHLLKGINSGDHKHSSPTQNVATE